MGCLDSCGPIVVEDVAEIVDGDEQDVERFGTVDRTL
jgi:hypothetical protein